jgi:hypothetical protein
LTATVATLDEIYQPCERSRHTDRRHHSAADTELFSFQTCELTQRHHHPLVLGDTIQGVVLKDGLCNNNLAAVVASRTSRDEASKGSDEAWSYACQVWHAPELIMNARDRIGASFERVRKR